MSPEERRERGK